MKWQDKFTNRILKHESGEHLEVDFQGFRCQLLMDRFADGSLCLTLVDLDENDQIARATVAVPAHPPTPGFIYVKDYGENEGMLDALCAAGVVTDTGRRLTVGMSEVAIAQVPPSIRKQYDLFARSTENVNTSERNARH